ncbi:MAG: ATPase, T2SS/T4P/T4SS family [Pseudomonadota bacterium]
MEKVNRLIGEMLLERNVISEDDLTYALNVQAELNILLGDALLKIGALSEDVLLGVLSEQMQIPILQKEDFPEKDAHILNASSELGLPVSWMTRQDVVIWSAEESNALNVAAVRPLSPEIREAVELACQRTEFDYSGATQYYLVKRATVEQLLGRLSRSAEAEDDDDLSMQKLREMAEEAPTIDFVNRLFEQSLTDRASDIHVEPSENHFDVRMRIDGVMRVYGQHPKSKFNAIISRIKLLSDMDIAEQRLPQDGRQSIRVSGENVDLRVSSLPGTWGESLVIRLLRKNSALPSITGLGLKGYAFDELQRALSHSNGVIFMTGPTGSGKSTTLYRLLEGLNDGERKIITIEDPVEYDMDDITQVQVRSDIGYTFQKGLRSILRHDPDIVMVGEIRDVETARIAAQAALTGHLVFSTLHTNSALGGMERLHDLGLERFMIASSARAFASQRLLRRLCEHCSQPDTSDEGNRMVDDCIADGAEFNKQELGKNWRRAGRCAKCDNTGYSGRVGIFEVAYVDEAMRVAITSGVSEWDIVKSRRPDGYMTIFEDGLLKASQGTTSLDELTRVTGKRKVSIAG